MNRRSLLGMAGLGILAPVIPGWMRVGFQEAQAADGHGDAPPEGTAHCANPYVKSTLDRARRLGKSTLVFVVPEDREELWNRRTLFGQFLNLCSKDALLDLSMCEVLCASQADLAVHVPEARRATKPLMILVDLESGPKFLKGGLPEVQNYHWGLDAAEFEKEILSRVVAIEKGLHVLVAPNREVVARRDALARKRLDADLVTRVESAHASSGNLEPKIADAAAAVVLSLSDNGASSRRLRESLITGTTDRLRGGPPFGAQWANATGCGSRVEAVPEGHPAAREEPIAQTTLTMCGMGNTPDISRRFLFFWGNATGND